MNAQSYVKEVGKRLECSEKKRKEIERQLASDIQAALENGESMEAILERMGTPKEAAEEFNRNFTEDDRKEDGRGRVRLSLDLLGMVVVAAVIIAVFVVVGSRWKHSGKDNQEKQPETTAQADPQKESTPTQEAPQITELTQEDDTFSREEIEEQTKQLIQAFGEEDFRTLYDLGTENLKHALGENYSDAAWKAAKDQISSEWGAFVSYGNIYMEKVIQDGQSFAVVQMNVSYEKVSATYTLTFDADMGLDGFYVK